jgi:histidine triad (HIT) family protein
MMKEPSCVFCRIVADQEKASFVYRDDKVTAFMDINPVNTGHMLVVPNRHFSNLVELNEAIGGHMFKVGQRLAQALRCSGLRCDGVNLFMADGAAAGQTVFHTHLHVIPRYTGDGFGFHFPASYDRETPRGDLDSTAAKVQGAIAGYRDRSTLE